MSTAKSKTPPRPPLWKRVEELEKRNAQQDAATPLQMATQEETRRPALFYILSFAFLVFIATSIFIAALELGNIARAQFDMSLAMERLVRRAAE